MKFYEYKDTDSAFFNSDLFKQALATLYSFVGKYSDAYNLSFSGWHNKEPVKIPADSTDNFSIDLLSN